ncbi:hypothetical protein [Actinotalea sp.]|uniref:hypothetical protein n=1 Tax=Actinotalea sp. TaxID=1872145 RepID=UPI0035646F38
MKKHLLSMLGIGGLIFVGLLVSGRSASEALYLAAVLACPVMMVGMMLMMRGQQHDDDHPTDEVTKQGAVATDAERTEVAADHRHR